MVEEKFNQYFNFIKTNYLVKMLFYWILWDFFNYLLCAIIFPEYFNHPVRFVIFRTLNNFAFVFILLIFTIYKFRPDRITIYSDTLDITKIVELNNVMRLNYPENEEWEIKGSRINILNRKFLNYGIDFVSIENEQYNFSYELDGPRAILTNFWFSCFDQSGISVKGINNKMVEINSVKIDEN